MSTSDLVFTAAMFTGAAFFVILAAVFARTLTIFKHRLLTEILNVVWMGVVLSCFQGIWLFFVGMAILLSWKITLIVWGCAVDLVALALIVLVMRSRVVLEDVADYMKARDSLKEQVE